MDQIPINETVDWKSLGLSDTALKLIQQAGFNSPTPVQALAIPAGLAGKDLIASAQTGTGKTASFVLPMADRFFGREGTFGLILAPTREIAQQIQETLEIFASPRGLRSIVLIGGIDMRYDAQALQTYPQIIVATPGRLCDHLERGNLWLDFIEVVVLDEADRMLDMGFSKQLNRIMEEVPKQRQTMLFSATFPPPVERLAKQILRDPTRISIGKPQSASPNIEQRLIWLSEEAKSRELQKLLRSETGSTIVFTRSKDGATRVWRSLHSAGFYDATYIHSDRLQAHREQALAEFKEGKYRILIATDVAGRGIHVDDVAHVVNYDLPLEPEDYIHRIGRTGRAGSNGKATTFATPRDRKLLQQIQRILGKPIPGMDVISSEPESSRSRPIEKKQPEKAMETREIKAHAVSRPVPSASGTRISPVIKKTPESSTQTELVQKMDGATPIDEFQDPLASLIAVAAKPVGPVQQQRLTEDVTKAPPKSPKKDLQKKRPSRGKRKPKTSSSPSRRTDH